VITVIAAGVYIQQDNRPVVSAGGAADYRCRGKDQPDQSANRETDADSGHQSGEKQCE